MKTPKYPVEWPIADDVPRRAAQEKVAPFDPEKLPALPYYDRHPEHRPPPLTYRQRRLLRRRGIF
jgi:hypothetical protein